MNDDGQHKTGCIANGCPCAGTHSSSTSGVSEGWVCWAHHGADPGAWQRITMDLNRMSWLVDACNAIRVGMRDYVLWEATSKRVQQQLRAHQRSDLCYSNAAGDTNVRGWLARLEGELVAIARGKQNPLPVVAQTPAVADTWQRATFDVPVPEHA